MAYSKGSKIGQNDVQFYTVRINNNLLGTGSGNYGYGQPLLNTNAPGPILKPEWFNPTREAIENICVHQVGTGNFNGYIYPAAKGRVIRAEPLLAENYQRALDNRLNCAVVGDTTSASVSIISSSSFSHYQIINATVSFGSHDKARYFFNAGGQLDISCLHNESFPANDLSLLASNMGNIRLGAGSTDRYSPINQIIGGVTYSPLSQVSGSLPAPGTPGRFYGYIPTSGIGFYNLDTTGIYNDLLVAMSMQDTSPPAQMSLWASYNNAGTLTFRLESYAYVGGTPPTAGAPTIPTGSKLTIVARQPSTRYLTDSWGPISFDGTVANFNGEPGSVALANEFWNNRKNYIRYPHSTNATNSSYPPVDGVIVGAAGTSTNYPVQNNEAYYNNNPNDRYVNSGSFTDTYYYYNASPSPSISKYFTVVSFAAGLIGNYGGITDTGVSGTDISIYSNYYAVNFIGNGAQPSQVGDGFGISYKVKVYSGEVRNIQSSFITTTAAYDNYGTWTYQYIIPGRWYADAHNVNFDPVTYQTTVNPGEMHFCLLERGGNGRQEIPPPSWPAQTEFKCSTVDHWWYNGADAQVAVNTSSQAQTFTWKTEVPGSYDSYGNYSPGYTSTYFPGTHTPRVAFALRRA